MPLDSINQVHRGQHCRTAWRRLGHFPHPSNRVRRCPHCHGLVYHLLGLSLDAAVALISATERRAPGDLYLRPDGTVSTSDRPCRRTAAHRWSFGGLLARFGGG